MSFLFLSVVAWCGLWHFGRIFSISIYRGLTIFLRQLNYSSFINCADPCRYGVSSSSSTFHFSLEYCICYTFIVYFSKFSVDFRYEKNKSSRAQNRTDIFGLKPNRTETKPAYFCWLKFFGLSWCYKIFKYEDFKNYGPDIQRYIFLALVLNISSSFWYFR